MIAGAFAMWGAAVGAGLLIGLCVSLFNSWRV
jgi:hypothetical protein